MYSANNGDIRYHIAKYIDNRLPSDHGGTVVFQQEFGCEKILWRFCNRDFLICNITDELRITGRFHDIQHAIDSFVSIVPSIKAKMLAKERLPEVLETATKFFLSQ